MKQKILLGIGVAALTLASCSEDWGNGSGGDGAGYILPVVEVDNKTISTRNESTRAELETLTKEDLTLVLSKADGTVAWEGKYSDFPTDKPFSIGSYKLEAKYGDPAEQGFEKPSLYGAQNLTVSDGATTQTNLSVVPSNSQVTIEYSEEFKNYMADWSASVNSIVYDNEESRPVYVTPGEVTIRINVTKPNDVSAQLALDKVTAVARYSYHVKVDINQGEASDAVLVVTFDENMDQDVQEIDLSDELLTAPAPEVVPDGFESGEPVEVIAGLSESSDLSMTIVSRAGIKSVNMKTQSASLTGQNWPGDLDLVKADGQAQQILTDLGLSVLGLWKNLGEMAYIDFSDVVSHIKVLEGGNNTTTFEVTVVDQYSRESDPVVLNLDVQPVKMVLTSSGDYYDPGTPLTFNFEFNGTLENLEEGKVTFQYYDATGMWRDVEIENVNSKDGLYQVSVIIPESHNKEVKIHSLCGGVTSNELTIGFSPITLDIDDLNVFATYGFGEVSSNSDEFTIEGKPVDLYVKGGKYETYTKITSEKSDGYYKFSDLEGGKNYTVKAKVETLYSAPVSIKTENEESVPNGDFEDLTGINYSGTANQGGRWTPTLVKVYRQNYSTFSFKEPYGWTTTNEKTMNGKTRLSQEDNTWFNQPSVFNSTIEYVVTNANLSDISTTTSTPDSYKGFQAYSKENAMVIRNVGWSPNGEVPGDDIGIARTSKDYYNHTVPTVDMHSVGKMFLGAYSYNSGIEVIKEGVEFTSRPKELNGWYIYKQDSNDKNEYGIVSVKVLDSQDQIIASGVVSLTNSENYTQFKVPLNYKVNSAKASIICIMVSSSNHEDGEEVKLSTYNSPYESYMHGATLVVDDFEFVY